MSYPPKTHFLLTDGTSACQCEKRWDRVTCVLTADPEEVTCSRCVRSRAWQDTRSGVAQCPVDPRIAQYEAERAEAIELAHKAMSSSYIGPPPKLRGDAERMVAALLKAGWTPPSGTEVEYAQPLAGGGAQVRAEGFADTYPVDQWISDVKACGGYIIRRKIIVVEDWVDV